MPLAQTAAILGQVADAVATAHAISLVHRDLKPENTFLEDDRAVVVDFGLAFILDEGGPRGGRLTEDGIATGTPDHMPPGPDVAVPRAVSHRSLRAVGWLRLR